MNFKKIKKKEKKRNYLDCGVYILDGKFCSEFHHKDEKDVFW